MGMPDLKCLVQHLFTLAIPNPLLSARLPDQSRDIHSFIFLPLYPLLVNIVLFNKTQGTEISLERPWRRETMHSLVKEATGIDFNIFGQDVESAKSAARGLPGINTGSRGSTSLQSCSSVGHVLNEVSLGSFCTIFFSFQ